jgi:release factor glutamine methyltransferase
VNLKQALNHARRALRDRNIEDAPLEGEILLKHVLGTDRASLFSHYELELTPRQEDNFLKVLARRLRGEPTPYITGHREFYGLDFFIDRHVLIPRPETELLVEKAIALVGKKPIRKIADIGTGSGAIAVSLAVNLPEVIVYATDISARALKVASRNCLKHRVVDRVILLRGDMLEPLTEKVDLIVANLPYVRSGDVQGVLTFEPVSALDGGADGFDTIRLFCRQAGKHLTRGGSLLMEIGQGQAADTAALLMKEFPGAIMESYRDLAGIERVVEVSLT